MLKGGTYVEGEEQGDVLGAKPRRIPPLEKLLSLRLPHPKPYSCLLNPGHAALKTQLNSRDLLNNPEADDA